MKKLLCLLLAIVMLLSMVACVDPGVGNNGGNSEGENEDSENSGSGSGGNSGSNNSGSGNSGSGNSGSGNSDSGNSGSGNSGSGNSGSGSSGSGNNGSGSSGSGNSGNISGETGSGSPSETPTPDVPADEMAVFEDFFNPNNHISIKLDIPATELKKLQQDYDHYRGFGSKSPIYRMADMKVTITKPDGSSKEYVIEQVGIRMKGNTSRTDFYNDNDGMYNLVHFKISFQETFDDEQYYGSEALVWHNADARKARKNRTFASLEKIDMRWNRNDDTTYIRENYAYELYRSFGVLAPHTNLASVDFNSDHAGVWVIYEPIDNNFLEKNLPASALGGDLYKLGWTHEGATFTSFSSFGVEDEDAGKFYVYDLKTNKKTSKHESLKTLINTLNSRSMTKDVFASVVDLENFLYYCAVSYMIGNPDDLRNNYNNTYIYFRADTGKVIFIPYDMDRGLGVNTWNPYNHGMTQDDPFSKYNVCGDQRNPLFLKSICYGGYYVNEFKEKLKEVDGSEMLTNESFKASFDVAAALYGSDTTPSKTYYNAEWCKFRFDINRTCSIGESKNMSFADYMAAKRVTLYKYVGDQGNNQGGSSGSGDNSGSTGGNTGGNSGGNSGGSWEEPTGNCQPYIMSNHNNWSVQSNYLMTDNGDGTYTFVIECCESDDFRFKVRDNVSEKWYGGEVLDPASEAVIKRVDSHTNIVLTTGKYTITFDDNTKTISITVE